MFRMLVFLHTYDWGCSLAFNQSARFSDEETVHIPIRIDNGEDKQRQSMSHDDFLNCFGGVVQARALPCQPCFSPARVFPCIVACNCLLTMPVHSYLISLDLAGTDVTLPSCCSCNKKFRMSA